MPRSMDRILTRILIQVLIEKVKSPEPALLADPQFRQRKAGILRKVLADDREVRRFTEPWMTRLEVYLGSSHQARRLHRAYQSDRP